MEKMYNNSWKEPIYSSLFHDIRSLDGKKNNLFWFFQELCAKIWLWSRNAQTKNFLFQQALCHCNAWQNLENFLCGMWYEFMEVFWDLDECRKFLTENKEIYFWIKRWEINIAIVYDNLTPVWIVLWKQNQSQAYIRDELDFLAKKISSIINFNT